MEEAMPLGVLSLLKVLVVVPDSLCGQSVIMSDQQLPVIFGISKGRWRVYNVQSRAKAVQYLHFQAVL
jgi:hypothetical protein